MAYIFLFHSIQNANRLVLTSIPNFFLNYPNGRTPMSDLVLHTSDATFEQEIINASLPVLLDFWAPWCGPCKMIAPILDEVAQEYTGKVIIAKLNIDENPAQPPKFGVRGIPTLMLLKNGQVAATRVGALSKSQLVDFLNSNLA
jgi:thioredoxin 1